MQRRAFQEQAVCRSQLVFADFDGDGITDIARSATANGSFVRWQEELEITFLRAKLAGGLAAAWRSARRWVAALYVLHKV